MDESGSLSFNPWEGYSFASRKYTKSQADWGRDRV